MPPPRLRFFGVAAYELIHTNGRRILIDPFLDDCPGNPVKSSELDRVDLIVVSHAASDHLGDTETIAKKHGCPVICGGEVRAYLTAKGVSHEQIRITTWGIKVRVAEVDVQPVECHHWSQIKLPDGAFAIVRSASNTPSSVRAEVTACKGHRSAAGLPRQPR